MSEIVFQPAFSTCSFVTDIVPLYLKKKNSQRHVGSAAAAKTTAAAAAIFIAVIHAMTAEREALRMGVENLKTLFPAEAKDFQFVLENDKVQS